MSMITLFSAFMGLYVIVRLILPSGMNWPFKLILSLFALACAEKLLLTKLVYGTMGAFMPEPVQLASGYLHSAVTILFLLLVVRDALLLLTWPFRRSTGRQRKIFYGHKEKKPASGFWAFTLVLLALALSGYGMREALRVPPVREVRMQVPGLPDALNGFRIAQLSDLHIGPTFGKAWLTDVVARTDSLNPDLIVITGDVVDGSPSRLEEDVAPLADLKAKYGVIFAPGNHEYYSGIQQWLPVFQRLGMHVLMNENTQIRVNGTPLAIAGVTDTAALNWGLEGPDPEKALSGLSKDITKLMLSHRPSLAPESAKAGASSFPGTRTAALSCPSLPSSRRSTAAMSADPTPWTGCPSTSAADRAYGAAYRCACSCPRKSPSSRLQERDSTPIDAPRRERGNPLTSA